MNGFSPLLDIQRRMAAAVMHPLTQSYAMPRRRRDGSSNMAEAQAIIRPNDRLTSFERLEIYNRQYWFRLFSSFEDDFPGLQAILGRARFDRLMREYLTGCPSESFTLRNLGSRLESWLNAHPEHIKPIAELALDMARLEWAHIEVFDAGERPSLKAVQLASIGEDSVLYLQPYLRLLALKYPVDDLLLAVRSATVGSASGANNASANNTSPNSASNVRRQRHARRIASLSAQPIWLAVHRQQNTVWYKRLIEEEFCLLSALAAGQPLGKAINAAFAPGVIPEDQRPAFLQQSFANWSAMGWFTDCFYGITLQPQSNPG